MLEDPGRTAPVAAGCGARLASAVMFVDEVDVSVAFYRELLGMEVTIRSTSPWDVGKADLGLASLYRVELRPAAVRALRKFEPDIRPRNVRLEDVPGRLGKAARSLRSRRV